MSKYRWLGIVLAAILAVPAASASADGERARKRDRAVSRQQTHKRGDRAVRRDESRRRQDSAHTRHPRPSEQSYRRHDPDERHGRHGASRDRDRDNWQGHRYDQHRPYRHYRNHQNYSRPHYRSRVRVHVHVHDRWCGHRGPVISFQLGLGSYWCDYHSEYCRHDYLCSQGYWMYDEWGYREYWVPGYCTHPRHEHPRSFYDYDDYDH